MSVTHDSNGQGDESQKKDKPEQSGNPPPQEHSALSPGMVPRSEKPQQSKLFERLSQLTILILFIATSIVFFPIISLFFIPIILAGTFAGLFYPMYRWIYNHLWHRKVLSSFISCGLLVLVVLIPAYILLHLIVDQVVILYRTAYPWFQNFMATWQDNPLVQQFLNSPTGKWLIEEINWSEIGNIIVRSLGTFTTTVVNKTYTGIFGLVVDLVIMLFVLFYLFIDGGKLLRRIEYLLPLKQEYQEMVYARFLLISDATIRGTFIIGVVDGVLGALTLLIFGIDSWLVWGFIIMVLSIIPMVGPSVVLLPAALIQIATGNVWQGIGILIVTYTVIVNADNVIRPYVVGSRAKMHELLVFFSTLGGLSVYGITGFIIGPIIASLLLTLLDIYAEEFRPQLSGRNAQH